MNRNNEIILHKSEQYNSLDDLLQNQNVISPSVDIIEMDDQFMLIANMPGLTRENLQVKVDKNNLIIFGKVDYQSKINSKYILQENEIGNFHRVFKISDTIEKNKITARFDNGQLIVILPINEKQKIRTIEIE